MRILAAAIAFLSLGWTASSASQERLHDGTRVFPEASFEDRVVTPIRKEHERAAGGGRWIYAPIVTLPLVEGAEPLPIVRGFTRFDLYRYEIYPEGDEPVEYLREFAQGIVDEELLPAARQFPEYADRVAQFETVEINIDDVLSTEAMVADAALQPGETPVVTIDYGLNNTLTATAWLFVEFDRFLSSFEDGNIETTYLAWDRFINAQVLLTASEYLHARDGARFFDQGVLLSLFPGELNPEERARFNIYVTNLVRLVVGHEVCHHLLDHPGNARLTRAEKELAADRCSLRLFRQTTDTVSPAISADQRHARAYQAIWQLSLVSQLIWPLQTGDEYPLPRARFTALTADNPMSSFPGVTDVYVREVAAMPLPLPEDRVLEAREMIISQIYLPAEAGDIDAETAQLIETVEEEIIDYCSRSDCLGSLSSTDVSLQFSAVRALLYLTSAQVESAERGMHDPNDLSNSRYLATRALEATDTSMAQTRAALNSVIERIDRLVVQ